MFNEAMYEYRHGNMKRVRELYDETTPLVTSMERIPVMTKKCMDYWESLIQ